MTFTFTATVAWDPIGKQAVKNVSFQVYATTDTGYTTPLAITDPNNVAIPGNILNSGTQGVFPQFNQATNSAVVITDPARTYVWTINCVPTDAAVANFISTVGSATAAQLSATYVPRWKATTAYLAGDAVLNPSGDMVTAIANFTSGASYNAANWNASPNYASQFTATPSTTTADINAWIAGGSALGVKRLVGSHTLTTPLIVPSNTYLDLSGASLTSTFVGNMWQNAAVATPIRTVANASITVGQTNLTAAGAAFTNADVGRTISLPGGGPASGALYTTIASVTNSTTAVLNAPAFATVASATLTIHARDTNITIVGGTWQRNAGGPTGGTVNGWANAAHSIMVRRVDKLTIRNLSIGSTGGKYFISLGDVTDFHISDITASSVASDTVHMTGPCSDGVVERVRVRSGGDDVVAFTTTDYVSYDDVHGDFKGVTVRDITANNATRVVLAAGSGSGADDGYTLKGVVIENIDQVGSGQGVTVAGPFSTALLPTITLRNIPARVLLEYKTLGTVIAENTGTVTLATEAGQSGMNLQRLVVRDPRPQAEIVTMNNSAVTVGDIEVNGTIFTGTVSAVTLLAGTVRTVTLKALNTNGTNHVITLGGAAVTTLNLDVLTGTVATGSNVINLTGGSLGTLNVTNPGFTAADTNSGILVKVTGNTPIGNINVNGGTLTGIARILDTPSGATGTVNLNMANLTLNGCNRILQAGDGTVNVSYANVAYNSGVNQPFRVFGAGNLNVRGSGWGGYTASTIPAPGTGVIHVTARDLPVDLSVLAKTNGDAANNTNAALACGAGPAICNGTNWKNVYSGTVY